MKAQMPHNVNILHGYIFQFVRRKKSRRISDLMPKYPWGGLEVQTNSKGSRCLNYVGREGYVSSATSVSSLGGLLEYFNLNLKKANYAL